MSIIHEALKKASEKNNPATRPQTQGPLLNQKRKTKMNWGPVLIVFMALFITTPIITPMVTDFFHPAMKMAEMPEPPAPLASENQRAQFELEEAPLPPMTPSLPVSVPALEISSFKLSGIVYSPEGSYCLINGQVLKAGDMLGKAKVVNVSSDSVTLESGEQTLKISM